MSECKLTIGLPVYNSEKYIREALDSILEQTYGDFILNINDNASFDDTEKICKEYANKDSRIRYSRNAENIGLAANLNLVADRCETPFFKWATADDYWAPTLLERTFPIIEADPSIALVYPKTIIVNSVEGTETTFDDKLHFMEDDPRHRFEGVLLNLGLCNALLGIMRTSALRKTSLIRSFPGGDMVFGAELALYGKIFELQEHLFFRRFHEDASSWDRKNSDHQLRRFHGANSKGTKLNIWLRELSYFPVIARSPLSLDDRLAAYSTVFRHMFRRRHILGQEAWHFATSSLMKSSSE